MEKENRIVRPRRMRSIFLAALPAICMVSGCQGGGSDLMSLDVGHTSLYIVNSPASFSTYVTPVKVSRQISVGNVNGVELSSTLGPSRLAWKGDALIADRLANTQFIPPLPLVYASEETHERPWKGRVIFVDRASPATATQSQKSDDELSFAGKKIHCIRSTIRLQTAARKIELITWFSPGLGIVRQEQRTDDRLLVRLNLLDKQ